MAKEPKKPDPKKPPTDETYETAHGPLPAEYWDNDQRFTGNVDKSQGSVYDYLTQRDKNLHKKK